MNPARPHGGLDALRAAFPFGIVVSQAGQSTVGAGVATCLVRRSVQPAQTYLLSCRHVLSLSLVDPWAPLAQLAVRAVGAGLLPLGTSTPIRGPLAGGMAPDFDAQLARVDAADGGQRALHGLAFDRTPPHVRSQADLQGLGGYWVATARRGAGGARHLVWVDHVGSVLDFTMTYTLPGLGERLITHTLVLRGTAHDRLVPGDSGSPAILTQRGGRLIGMYIGGDGVNAYVLPAWQLLDPRNYGLGSAETWALA